MSKMIAVCGAPACGKTTIMLKLAQEIQAWKKTRVLCISPDLDVPSLSYIFPHRKSGELVSLGRLLDRTEITPDDVLQHLQTMKPFSDLGVLGYCSGDTRYSFPRVTKDKMESFLNAAFSIAPYILVDCANGHDLFSEMLFRKSDHVVRLIVPDLKSMSYTPKEKSISVPVTVALNIPDRDLYLPIDDVKSRYGDVVQIPYSYALKQQGILGTLSDPVPDNAFLTSMKVLSRRVV